MNDEVGRAGGLFFRFCLRFRLSPFCFTFFHFAVPPRFPPRSHSLFSRFNCFSDGGGDEQAPSHLLLVVHCRRREGHVDSGRGRRRRRVTAPAVGGRGGGGGEGRRAAAQRTAAASGTCPLTDVSSMFSCRNKRLTRYHPLSICLRGNRTAGS